MISRVQMKSQHTSIKTNRAERINSCANQVLTLGNTLLSDGEMEKLVMCQMNQDFIIFMRKHYPEVANKQFEFGILKAEDNEEEEDE